ncbi:hypothetical protein PVK06_040057 [Gossypium arboreum]|uniref:MULE transposase domain-containing protein n=1 Tax=Gossypium arboreum TaxID=29729 RepID=A0ABR0N4H0_GOSAR|nr:hypothetical protein PVK06_040057 [Gossypium arboreum]
MMSTSDGTSYVVDDGGLDDEFDVDPSQEPGPDGAEVVLFFEPKPVLSEPEDVEGDEALEFLDLLCRRRDRTNVSQDHPKMDSGILASLILPMVKADPRIFVSVLIANIRSQLRYMSSYRKAWIAKQKALKKMYSGWDTSYNEVWQWCQVLERYVSGCITGLETVPAYYNDRLLRGCQVYTYRLLLVVAQDGGGRILSIGFAITPGESVDDWDFFLSWLRIHVCPQPDIYVISD